MNKLDFNKGFCTHTELMNIAHKCAIQALCKSGYSLFDEELTDGTVFTSNYGEVLYDACPGVHYVIAEDLEDARRQFLSLMDSVIEFTSTHISGSTILIDLEEKGVIEFTAASENGAVAQINVNLTHVPELSQVIYISQNAWPRNAGDANIKLGDAFLAPSGNRWICVKTCQNGPGYLATFDIYEDKLLDNGAYGYYLNKVVDPFLGDHAVKQDEVNFISYLHYNHATEVQLRALNQFMYNDDGSCNNQAVSFFRKNVDARMFESMYREGCIFICGDDSRHCRTTTEYKYSYYRYSARQAKWVLETQKSTYIFMGAKFYLMKKFYKESVVHKESWNSYSVPSICHYSGIDHINHLLVRFFEYNSTFQKDNFGLKKIPYLE